MPVDSVNVLVPNPVCFMVQKLLIHSKRPAYKKAHDILFIHDTLQLFGASLTDLRSVWRDQVRLKMPTRTANTVMRNARSLFEETDVIRDAARIPADRFLSPKIFARPVSIVSRSCLMPTNISLARESIE